jgi:hypothetical protein
MQNDYIKITKENDVFQFFYSTFGERECRCLFGDIEIYEVRNFQKKISVEHGFMLFQENCNGVSFFAE